MSLIATFECGECGYGPYFVDDNREAPIPEPPIIIYSNDSEGAWLSTCGNCEAVLPIFIRKRMEGHT